MKQAGLDTTEVEQNLEKELDEWRTDRQKLHSAQEKAKRFETENTNLRRDNLALQVLTFLPIIMALRYSHLTSC